MYEHILSTAIWMSLCNTISVLMVIVNTVFLWRMCCDPFYMAKKFKAYTQTQPQTQPAEHMELLNNPIPSKPETKNNDISVSI